MTLQHFALEEQLTALKQAHLYRQTKSIERGVTPYVWQNGQPLLNFSSNDYLGLADSPMLRDAVHQALKMHGIGAGAAHLVTGHTELHDELEQSLADYTGYEKSCLFSSGYMANLGVISALANRHSVILQDKLNHASLLDGARLAGARLTRYIHRDMQHLIRLLEPLALESPKLMISDTVFSMDGTRAPLDDLQYLSQHYQAALMLDDAHGFGAYPQIPPFADVYMATLGKALGSFGAFVAGSSLLIDYLKNQARTFCFSTATPALLAAAALAALNCIQTEPYLRQKLRLNINQLRCGLQAQGWALTASDSAIQPVIVGSAQTALALSAALKQRGFLVVAIRPPTVPSNTARLRISLSAAHTSAHIDALLQALQLLRAQIDK